MRYTPKELKVNVNVSPVSPLREMFVLLGGVLGIVIVVYVAAGFALDFVVTRLPEGLEDALGRQYMESFTKGETTVAEERLQVLLDGLSQEMPGESKDFRVFIMPHDMANAGALPGGIIVVFSELVKGAESENELAYVLAHELGHFANRDHLRGLGRSLVMLSISAALFGADSSATRFIMDSMVNVEMKFSQHNESQADIWALDLLNKKYGHVAGATDFFSKAAEREKRGRLQYFFATHPFPEDRIRALQEHVRKMGYGEKEKIPLDEAFRDFGP